MTADPQPTPAATAEPIIGIDLGTTNSLVAHCTEAGPAILESPEGERSLPSVVRLLTTPKPRAAEQRDKTPDPSPYTLDALGRAAHAHAVEHPTTTLHSVKRLMGRSVQDVISDLPYLPYAVVEGPHATARIALPTDNQAEPVTVTPQEVSAMILRELKRWADAALGTDVRKAVITVPAYFDDAQRQATRDAGRLAGLQVMRIVNEPTAAALAYGLGMKGSRGQGAKGPSEKTSLLTQRTGNTVSLSTKLNPEACSADPSYSAPEPLSPSAPAPSQTVAIYDLGGGTFDVSILRLQPTEHGTIDQVLATDGDTHLGGDDFDHTLIQLIQDEIRQQANLPDLDFPPTTQQAFRTLAEQTKVRLSTEDSAEIQIDLGEPFPDSYQRSVTRDEFESLIEPLLQRSLNACRRAIKNAKLSVDDIDRVILVGGSTRVPRVRQKVAELFQTTPYTALNPDEVVALGASVQAAVLAGVHRDTLLLDVIPLSLGIETMGGAVAKLIVANSAIPARATEMFSTYAEGQTNVKIHVLQGERELVQDCRSLATFDLTGIPPMPAGLPKINVTFLVDANGILSVQAVEERSGRRAQVQVVPNHGLTRDEISQIEADSFTFARQDMNTHRLIDLRLNAKLDIRNIRKQLDRFDGESEKESAIDPDYRALIEKHLETVEAFIDAPDEENDADAFQKALHELDHATIRLAELNIARTLKDSQKPG